MEKNFQRTKKALNKQKFITKQKFFKNNLNFFSGSFENFQTKEHKSHTKRKHFIPLSIVIFHQYSSYSKEVEEKFQ